MINAAIADGDWVVVRQQPVAENGDIVAAMIDGEATVKTFKRSGDHVWLMPHNPAYTPIPGDEARSWAASWRYCAGSEQGRPAQAGKAGSASSGGHDVDELGCPYDHRAHAAARQSPARSRGGERHSRSSSSPMPGGTSSRSRALQGHLDNARDRVLNQQCRSAAGQPAAATEARRPATPSAPPRCTGRTATASRSGSRPPRAPPDQRVPAPSRLPGGWRWPAPSAGRRRRSARPRLDQPGGSSSMPWVHAAAARGHPPPTATAAQPRARKRVASLGPGHQRSASATSAASRQAQDQELSRSLGARGSQTMSSAGGLAKIIVSLIASTPCRGELLTQVNAVAERLDIARPPLMT